MPVNTCSNCTVYDACYVSIPDALISVLYFLGVSTAPFSRGLLWHAEARYFSDCSVNVPKRLDVQKRKAKRSSEGYKWLPAEQSLHHIYHPDKMTADTTTSSPASSGPQRTLLRQDTLGVPAYTPPGDSAAIPYLPTKAQSMNSRTAAMQENGPMKDADYVSQCCCFSWRG